MERTHYWEDLEEDCAAGPKICYNDVCDEDMYGSSSAHEAEDSVDCGYISAEQQYRLGRFSSRGCEQTGGTSCFQSVCDGDENQILRGISNMTINHSTESGYYSNEITSTSSNTTHVHSLKQPQLDNNNLDNQLQQAIYSDIKNCNSGNSESGESASLPCDMFSYVDEDGDTQLHIAVSHRREDIVADILMCDLLPSNYVNFQDANGQTALHLAVLTNQPNMFRILIQHRADPCAYDFNGDTPLHVACRAGFYNCVRTLVTLITFLNSLHDPNIRNYKGFTCLHLAAENGHQEITAFLVNSFRVDINAGDGCSGRTILHHAANRGDLSFIKFLINTFGRRLNINTCAHDKQTTALNIAHGREFYDITEILKNSGAIKVSDYDLFVESDSESEMSC